MKIDYGVNPLNSLDGVSSTDRAGSVRKSQGKNGNKPGVDRATLSDGAQMMSKAIDELRNAPEVREEKLESIRQQILNGEYRINYDVLAQKLATKAWLQ